MTKVFVYVISLMISLFAVSGINFDNIIKKNHVWEARFLALIISISLGYLVANFFIDFMESSQIIKYMEVITKLN